MTKRPTVECKPNGPYVVKDLQQLTASNGKAIATTPVVFLCRCGGSANKPFCDGTHRTNGFSGAGPGGAAGRRDAYPGRKITIHDDRSICAHAARCTEGLPQVFKYGSEPWIDPDAAANAAIIQTVRSCPSGALSYSVEGAEHRDQPRPPMITVTKDGPYALVGSIELIDQRWAEGASTEHCTLCRCGGSKSKPFCDGTHWSIGFKDEKN